MKPAKQRRCRVPVKGHRSLLETLEDRRLLSVYGDLATALTPGSLTPVQDNLNTALNAASKIPLLTQGVGGALGKFQAVQIVTDTVVGDIKTAVASATDDTNATTALTSALGVGSGDVLITHPGGASTIEIEVHLNRALAAATVPANFNLNLGLSGLPVNVGASTTGSIGAQLSYDFAFAFGFNGSNLFVDTNKKVSDFANSLPDPNHQLVVEAVVKPSNDFVATATVGLLQANIDNRSHTSTLDGAFTVDNLGLSGTPTVGLTGNANLNLHAAASFAATTDTNSGASFTFPGIGADLIVNWNLAPGNNPAVSYDNVSFELGSFLSGFVRPIIQDIQVFTQPIEPLISVLTAPLPGLTDLSHLIGQGDVTLLGIAEAAAANGAFGPGIDEAVELIATLVQITKDVNGLDTSNGGVMVPLGDFALDTSGDANDVTTSLLNGTVDFNNLANVGVDLASNLLKGIESSNAIKGIEDAADKIGLGGVAKDQLMQLGKRLDSLQTGGVKLNFPIIDDPASVIFPMLLGHDGDFATFDANLNFNADEKGVPTGLSAFGLGINASGNIQVQANIHVAYDTFGVREFFKDLAKPGGSAEPGDLLDGFYIADTTASKPQFAVGGKLQLGVSASTGFFSVEVGGGVFTGDDGTDPITINLHDADKGTDDNKLRLSKIGADPLDPGCLFDVSGKLTAGAGVTVKVGVDTPLGFVGYEHTFNIATVTLFDLDTISCLGKGGIPAANPPVIAGDPSTGMPLVDGAGTMTLFLGDNAGQRKNIPSTTDDAMTPETWQVTNESGDPSDTLTIKAFGVTQKIAGVKKIVAVGHLASQTISIDDSVAADAELTGGDLDDQLAYLGTGTATLDGGGGKDRVTVGSKSKTSVLHGGPGDDILIGGGGDDKLYGDAANDTLFAGTGNQTLDGGANNDQINAGKGVDMLIGGTGNDLLSWHVGNGAPTVVDGGADTNTLEVLGDGNADTFTASANAGALSILADLVTFTATHIHNLSLDGTGGADVVTVNNLASTSVQEVHVNQSEEIAADSAGDAVTVDAAAGTNLLIDQAVGEVTPGVKGAQVLLNGLAYKVFVANSEAQDSLAVNTASVATTVTLDLLRVDSVSGSPLPKAIAIPGHITVNDAPVPNIFNVKSTSGPTIINASGGNNIFNVGSLAPATGGTLAGITGALRLNGSGGADAANIDDSGDAVGRTGTLASTTVTGLGNVGDITYAGLSVLTIGLGMGNDQFTVSSTHAGSTNLDGGTGQDAIDLLALDGPTIVHGGDDDDTITLKPTVVVGPTFLYGDKGADKLIVDQLPAGNVSGTVNLDGGAGADNYVVNITGAGSYLVNVSDSGVETFADTLTINGTTQADNFLLRASAPGVVNGIAFVAALHGDPVSSVERVNYNKDLKSLILNTGDGADSATVDDDWAPTTINGGQGNDHFQVGQIFKSPRDAAAGVTAQDVFETFLTTRGYLSNGVSFETTINGDDDNDDFVVFRNKAVLNLNGDDGDDTFTIRAFAGEGSTDTDVNGGKDTDLIQYVENAKVNVDGGDGTDTLRVIGTEFADRFVVTKDGIFGAGLNISYINIEKLDVDGAEGDDEFYVLSTGPGIDVTLFGGLGNDLFSIAGDTVKVKSGTTTLDAMVGSHTVKLIQGPLHIDGAGGKGSTGGLGTPVMLPGETSMLTSDGKVLAYSGTGTSLSIDTMTVKTAALETARIREMLASITDLVGKTLEISKGPGIDRFWQITGVAIGAGTDTTLTLKSPGMPADEWGLPDTTSEFAITHLSPNFFVSELDTLDALGVFNDGSTAADVGGLSDTSISGLGMSAAGITYANLETIEVLLGTGNDTFTVTGTAAGAITAVHGGGGGDHLIVTAGGGMGSPLLVYGDTTQDRGRYTADGVNPLPGFGFAFTNDGDDTIDASADMQTVAIYGGAGKDVIYGSQVGDHLAGGAGDDEIHGQGGVDHIYGDSGFNQDLSTRLDHVVAKQVQILQVVTTETAGNDKIFGDDGDDIIFGDHGIITQTPGTQRIFTTDNVIGVQTTNVANGGDDEIHGGADNDVILGGMGNDRIDGDAGQDLILGDNAVLTSRAAGVMTNPRFRALAGTQLYDASGNPQVTSDWQTAPGALPMWANWSIVLNDGNFGNDYLAGGAGNDTLFGQSGDDTIQGDGSISLTVSSTLPSVDDFAGTGTDGDDYIEGGGGNDVILGNRGQDDLIGGSSNLFGLTMAAQRQDGSDTIFGGSGTTIARNDPGDLAAIGHDLDADTILGDNGNIYRILGTNGVSGGAYLTFNYDTYGSVKIIPRAVTLLDYTQGGSGSDLGSADVLHGEAGDDEIHGETGNDVLFGEGQDDNLYGESGNDRIYGGAGEDGVLGDDGRIITSRNGLTEPLYGLTTPNALVDLTIPGPFIGAWEFITGRLNKTVTVAAWTSGGNDVIYGGLGDDFLHGGAGDDAISGAEAQAAWYNSLPVGAAFYANGGYSVADSNNPLGYNAATRKLAAYDANNPLMRIDGFFLNFDAVVGGTKIEDGKDRIFGDLGNDWLVGGTGNDRLFGGKGDDVLNADDNLDTAGGLNNQPDATQFADRDFAYGGDGLDVLIANTGGDRLFDWSGEFNTFVTPFSPFGDPTVVRWYSPQNYQFLLNLGRTSGADQTLVEPNGEIGLFLSTDPEWGQNVGAPRDPQAGNTQAGRDTLGSPEDDRNTALPLTVLTASPAARNALQINSVDVTVNNVVVTQDPSNPAQLALFVGGGSGDDVIEVRPGSSSGILRVVINGVVRGDFARTGTAGTIGRIIVYGNDGNDTITVSTLLDPIAAVLYGGAGNDTLRGGLGNNILDGGAGNDNLYGGAARDLLIGGLGQDTVSGGAGDDLLIGGTYLNSQDLDAVAAVLAEWTSSHSYSQRLTNLRNGVGAFAQYKLNTVTVLDDFTIDYLTGGDKDQDWFWASATDRTDRKSNETIN